MTDTQATTNPRTKRKPTFYAYVTKADGSRELLQAADRNELLKLLHCDDIKSVDLVVRGYPLNAKTEHRIVLQ